MSALGVKRTLGFETGGRMTARIIATLLVALFGLPALAAEMPPRKPGLWEILSPDSSAALRQCIDATTDQLLQARGGANIGPGGISPQCAKRDVQKSGDTWTFWKSRNAAFPACRRRRTRHLASFRGSTAFGRFGGKADISPPLHDVRF
jgi:hypothetical protein